MIEVGLKFISETVVDESNIAKTMGSGELPVFATPAMIALMEQAAYMAVKPYLGENQGSVGTLMNVKHVSASPIGMKITAESEVVEVDNKRIVFSVKAFDEKGLIGEGTHERFIIDNERFMQKTNSKRD